MDVSLLSRARLLPFNDRVLVRPLPPAELTAGGLVIPDVVQQELPGLGTVLAVAANVTIMVAVGDLVTFARHAGTPTTVQGEECLLVRATDILGVFLAPLEALGYAAVEDPDQGEPLLSADPFR